MQSRRVWLPTITGPVSLAEVCARAGAAVADPSGVLLTATTTHSATTTPPAATTHSAASASAAPSLVIIGPEGGFDDDEIPSSVPRVSLGDTILRAETATLVAATLLADMRHRNGGDR